MRPTANEFKIDSATWTLVRYEPGFGTGELGPQVGSKVELCTLTTSGSKEVSNSTTAPVVPGTSQTLVMKDKNDGNGFSCGFDFKEFGTANALNDIYEIEVDVNMKSSAARRRLLRKTIRLKAGELHSSVGV